MSDDLARIYIRARTVSGGWGSYSLRELLDSQNAGRIGDWFIRRILDQVGFSEGEIVTEAHAVAMVKFLDDIGVGIVRLREPIDAD